MSRRVVITTAGLLLVATVQYLAFRAVVPRLVAQSFADHQQTALAGQNGQQRVVLGYSGRGRPIFGYDIGQGDRCLLFVAGEHGNEKSSTSLLITLLQELERDPTLVPSDTRVFIVPLVNPDGYAMRDDKLNAHGVNLNRNFPTSDWIEQEDPDNPETYAGAKPLSESESLALRRAFTYCDPDIYLSFHAQGALVSPEHNEASVTLGQWYAEQTGYEYFDEWDFPGTATKWFAETTNRPSLTIELSTYNESDWEINKNALFALISGLVQ